VAIVVVVVVVVVVVSEVTLAAAEEGSSELGDEKDQAIHDPQSQCARSVYPSVQKRGGGGDG